MCTLAVVDNAYISAEDLARKSPYVACSTAFHLLITGDLYLDNFICIVTYHEPMYLHILLTSVLVFFKILSVL